MSDRGSWASPHWRPWILSCAAAIVLHACEPQADPCFDPPGFVPTPRILAVRADPPDVAYEPDDAPPAVRLRAIVGTPGTIACRTEWRVCAPSEAGGCADAAPIVAGGESDTDHIDSMIAVPPAVIAEALEADPLRGYGGIRVLADLRVHTTEAVFRATKLLLFSPRGAILNGPVDLEAVEIARQDRSVLRIRPGEAVMASVPERFGVRPVLREGSVEEYSTQDLSGRFVHLRERISYEFFATDHLFFGDPIATDANGGFSKIREDSDRATEPPPETSAESLVFLHALAKTPRAKAWVVARDGRGGVAWAEVAFNVSDERCCCEGGAQPFCCPANARCHLAANRTGCPDLIEPVCRPPTFSLPVCD